MPAILISLISDQTIPNLLLIKELEGCYDQMVFISTLVMESSGKSKWIEEAAGIEKGSISRIIVEENDWTDIGDKLQAFPWPKDARFIVNQTGGTKVMTLAVYEYFACNNNQIVYIPIGQNHYEELYPRRDQNPVIISYRINLQAYLMSHGLYFESTSELLATEEYTRDFFQYFRIKRFVFYKVPEIMEAQQMPTEKERVYFGGEWFEEYIYCRIKRELNIGKQHIALNVKVFRSQDETQNDNEYDIMFTHDNRLFVIECKASVGSKSTIKDKMDHYLYKLGAITRDFGLKVNTYIFTLSNVARLADKKFTNIEKRRKLLGIKAIVDARDFINGSELSVLKLN